ncbi:hypothetical protein [Solibacillus sp. FSL K6-1523]|uniref:hypothetical protein n=1 Tax=Solibacillus sp. FSL K6-1523 TaxID=2921471 RepID=UPI0030FABC47
MSEKTFNIIESAKAQAEYCKETGAPHFAPRGGTCWNCNKNIYEELPHRNHTSIMCGISVEEAKTQLVTGCPHCNRSYCD